MFDLGFGNLAGNSAKTFSIYYGATTSEATAMSALTHVNAEMYSLGQSAPDGTPGTFIFGFKGVGGQPLEVKAPPIVPLTPVPEIQDDKPPFPDGKVPSKDRDSSTPVITDGSSPSASDGRGGSAAGDLSSSPSSPSASDGRGGSADDLSSSTSDGKTYDLSISTTFNPTPSQTARNIAVNNVIDAFNQANENVGQLTQGFIYQTLVNNTAIFQPLTDVNNPDGAKIRKNLEELANGRSTLFQFGRGAGDLVGLAQGLLEIGGGGGTTSGGAVLTSTGFGTVPGGLVMAAGVAQVLHGASVGGASAQDLGKLISYVFASSGSGGSSVNPGGQGASGQSTESFYDAETRRLAREHKILYDEASALKEVLESPATKPDGLLVVGEDKVAKFFGVDRNDFKLPEFIAQRKDGKFIAAEVKNQNEADIASALGKFEDVVKLVKNLKGKYQGMGEHRMGQFLIFVRKGFSGFNDRTFSVGQNGLLLQNGEIYRVDGIPVQVKARDLVPQSQTGGR